MLSDTGGGWFERTSKFMMILPFYTVSKVHLIINNTNQTIKRDSENKEKNEYYMIMDTHSVISYE